MFKVFVIKFKIGFRKSIANEVKNTLKIKFPKTTLFLVAFPSKAPRINLIVVPVSDPKTIAAAIGKFIASTCSALRVSAIVTELD